MNTVPLTFLSSSYHHLKKYCHSGKQGPLAGLRLQYLRSSVDIVIFRRPVPLGKGEATVGTRGGFPCWLRSRVSSVLESPLVQLFNLLLPMLGFQRLLGNDNSRNCLVCLAVGINDKPKWQWCCCAETAQTKYPRDKKLFWSSPCSLHVLALGHRVSVSPLFSMQHKHYSYTKESERLRLGQH